MCINFKYSSVQSRYNINTICKLTVKPKEDENSKIWEGRICNYDIVSAKTGPSSTSHCVKIMLSGFKNVSKPLSNKT